jgi:virginiamycin B lyase
MVIGSGCSGCIAFQTGSLQAALADTPPALSGQISWAKEGPMEGVVVSAKRAGATITISVVSDAKGHYSLPASKIGPGDYDLKIRAIGYDLEGPNKVVVRQL